MQFIWHKAIVLPRGSLDHHVKHGQRLAISFVMTCKEGDLGHCDLVCMHGAFLVYPYVNFAS